MKIKIYLKIIGLLVSSVFLTSIICKAQYVIAEYKQLDCYYNSVINKIVRFDIFKPF